MAKRLSPPKYCELCSSGDSKPTAMHLTMHIVHEISMLNQTVGFIYDILLESLQPQRYQELEKLANENNGKNKTSRK